MFYIRTSIIRISWLSGLFLQSQFCHEYLLVLIKIRGHILQLKASLFCFQRAKAAFACIVTNEEHFNEFWLAQICFFSKRHFIALFYGINKQQISDICINIHIFDDLDTQLSRLLILVPMSPDNGSSTVENVE